MHRHAGPVQFIESNRLSDKSFYKKGLLAIIATQGATILYVCAKWLWQGDQNKPRYSAAASTELTTELTEISLEANSKDSTEAHSLAEADKPATSITTTHQKLRIIFAPFFASVPFDLCYCEMLFDSDGGGVVENAASVSLQSTAMVGIHPSFVVAHKKGARNAAPRTSIPSSWPQTVRDQASSTAKGSVRQSPKKMGKG